MNYILRKDAEAMVRGAIRAVCPDDAVRRALENVTLTENVYLVAVGKAAWQMADAAVRQLEKPVRGGIVLTKYGHVMGELPGITCLEAGHPVPDENSFHGTEKILKLTENLTPEDTVLFLLSGGGSALFEKPRISADKLFAITNQLLSSGAGITEINAIRKRLSCVKGGRFARWCAPAKIEAIILSDVLGDQEDMIASGPAAADTVTTEQVMAIAEKYKLIDDETLPLLRQETPKILTNVHSQVIGSVRELCRAAETIAAQRGYEAHFLTDRLECEASEAGVWLANILKQHQGDRKAYAFITGGETVVTLKGTGLGGRNQELALSAAEILADVPNGCIISAGSDGTDGPTDAAGGYVDSHTLRALKEKGICLSEMLENNDSYHALKAVDGLIFTGPTGTNVNDITIGLISV